MKVNARVARESGRSYAVFLDGVDVSDCCMEADDIAHTVTVFIRNRAGEDVRRQSDHRRLTATVHGHVVITERVGAGVVQ